MRAFFDTNVLVYLFDADAPQKQRIARALLEREANAGRATLSTQVLQEFFVTVTRKLAVPLGHEQAERAVRSLAELSVVQIDAALILEAIDTSRHLRISLWDALIVRAALQSGSTVLYTEDLQHGQEAEGLKISNPFVALQTR
ncbi:MAG: PIN domain-containing protein [Burkholderiaceae bacterium]|nr:PIN domain-containing protein [Burkholderiaceae bacterium]